MNNSTNLNLSGCESLVDLYCDSNKLTKLDLRNLDCRSNMLTELDLSDCIKVSVSADESVKIKYPAKS